MSAPTPTPEPSSSHVSMADAKRCPVTVPRNHGPLGQTYGNGKLRVALWPHGVIAVGRDYIDGQGRVRMKFPWWRMVHGRLRIMGHRLDAPAPPAIAHVPHGYGPGGFQASGVTFPTEGCWEVTGMVGQDHLTFVTFVIKKAQAE